jgi:hypothetical protein
MDEQRRAGMTNTKAGSFRGSVSNVKNYGSDDPMNNYIQDFSSVPADDKSTKFLEYMTGVFKAKSFNPARIHSMADHGRTKTCSLN